MPRDPADRLRDAVEAYFAVDDSIVWDAAANKAPQLLAACRRLLGE